MISLSGFKSITLVNGDTLPEGQKLLKEPLSNTVIYEYNKKSTVKTTVNDAIIVNIENKIDTLKFDDWFIQVTKSKIEDVPSYSIPVFDQPPLNAITVVNILSKTIDFFA